MKTEKTYTEKLIEMGGSDWQKGDYHRIYFNVDACSKLYGFDLSFYNTGNICSARLNGGTVSNSQASRKLGAFNEMKLYFDVNDEKYRFNSEYAEAAREIITIIKSKLV